MGKSLTYLTILFLLAVGSCVPVPSATSTGPRTMVLDGKQVSEANVGGFTCWYCKDFISGEEILLEVGFFGLASFNEIGFVLYDGGFSGVKTTYHRTGLEHRWDWGESGSDAFVIKTDGTGAYYDFTTVSEGESTKPRDI